MFQAELRTLAVKNSSALGGAVRAAHAVQGTSFAELAARFSAPDDTRITPTPGSARAYDELRGRYAEKLAEVVR